MIAVGEHRHAPAPRALLVGRRGPRWVQVRRALQRLGYEVNEASNGAAALALAEVMEPGQLRLVVLLPGPLSLGVGAQALARRLREARPGLRVVIAGRDSLKALTPDQAPRLGDAPS